MSSTTSQQYGGLPGSARGEYVAKRRGKTGCRFTGYSKRAWLLEICDGGLLKSGASRQEKASVCNRNGATGDEHIGDTFVLEGCLDGDAAGAEDLDALLDDDGLVALRKGVADEVCDGASGGGAGGGAGCLGAFGMTHALRLE